MHQREREREKIQTDTQTERRTRTRRNRTREMSAISDNGKHVLKELDKEAGIEGLVDVGSILHLVK